MSIKEIANLTGASVSTVSRVLRDPNHKCASEEMRQKILQAARDTHFVPNKSAQNLKTGRCEQTTPRYINILLTRSSSEGSDPFFDEMLRLTEFELRNSGYIISNVWHKDEFSDEKFSMTENISKLVCQMYENNEHKSDGLVIIGKCCARGLKALRKFEKNLVAVSRNSANFEVDEVLCDGRKIALMAMGYLARCGHNRIGYVGNCYEESRFYGYQEAQIQYHLNINPDYVFSAIPSEEHGWQAMEYFLKLDVPPTGIYCANDILAIGMLKCLSRHRNRHYLPSIIASDDIEQAQRTSPMLSSVSLPKAEMIRLAVMLLTDRINGGHKSVLKLEFNGSLVIRESCRSLNEVHEPEYYI